MALTIPDGQKTARNVAYKAWEMIKPRCRASWNARANNLRGGLPQHSDTPLELPRLEQMPAPLASTNFNMVMFDTLRTDWKIFISAMRAMVLHRRKRTTKYMSMSDQMEIGLHAFLRRHRMTKRAD